MSSVLLDERWIFEGNWGSEKAMETADSKLHRQGEELDGGVIPPRGSMRKLKLVLFKGQWRARARALERVGMTTDWALGGEASFSLSFESSFKS